MGTTIRNARPGVLHIPDAGLRLEAGQTRTLDRVSPQTEALLAAGALVVVPAPAVAPSPVPPAPLAPAKPMSEKRGGHRAAPTLPLATGGQP